MKINKIEYFGGNYIGSAIKVSVFFDAVTVESAEIVILYGEQEKVSASMYEEVPGVYSYVWQIPTTENEGDYEVNVAIEYDGLKYLGKSQFKLRELK
jgi:hypothetical protein